MVSARSKERWSLLLGVAVILSLGTCIGGYEYRTERRDWNLAERGVASYAWVTRVSARWSTFGRNRLEDKCELDALIPKEVQREPPPIAASSALIDSAATYFTSVEPDAARSCHEYLHTWQRVLFDPQDRARARFAFGYRSPLQVLFERSLLLLLLAMLYGCFRLFKRWRTRRST
jgi:hypothetical protein